MKVLLIGGLGFLGVHVGRMAHSFGWDVDVIDSNLYEKFNEDELPLSWIGELRLVDIISKDCDVKTFDVYDRIYILSDHDTTAFYGFVEMEEYLGRYVKTLKQIEKIGKRVLHIGNNEIYRRMGKCPSHVKRFTCPLLFGSSSAIRTDTFINSVVISLALEKQYILDEDTFETYEFCHVVDYARYLIGDFAEDTGGFSGKLSVLMLCNMLNWMFGEGYVINIQNVFERTSMKSIDMYFTEHVFDSLRAFVNEMKAAVQGGYVEELLLVNYNNTMFVNRIIEGKRYRGKLELV